MSFKSLSKTLLVAAFTLAVASTAIGQVKVEGTVVKKGTDQPFITVAGVKIVCFRFDVVERCGEAVSDANGKYSFEGLAKEAQIGFGISGSGIAPSFYPVFAVSEPRAKTLFIVVSDGDGGEAQEAQLRDEISGKNLSEEEKAERNKNEIALIDSINSIINVKAKNELLEKLIKEGNDAFNAGDFDTAIAKFSQGYDTDRQFLGSAPTFLNNKSVAIKRKAVKEYNEAARSGDSVKINEKRTALANGLMESVELSLQTIGLVKGDSSLTSEHAKTNEANFNDATKNITDSFRILGQLKITFPSDSEEAAKKGIDLQLNSLKHVPDDPGILGSLMLSMYNMGFWGDESYFQKSLNYGDYYLKKAPKDHNRRAAVAQIVDLLKTENKLKPQPIN